jgi:hypothetical protein
MIYRLTEKGMRSTMKNRRKQPRYGARLKGHIWTEGFKYPIETENLSASGVRITLDAPLLEGAEVKLCLNVAIDGETETTPITVKGVVVWCNEDMDAGFQSGIRFSVIEDSQRRFLEGSLPSYAPV